MYTNSGKKELLKSTGGLLSHHLPSSNQCPLSCTFGACYLNPKKSIGRFQKLLFSSVCISQEGKIKFSHFSLLFLVCSNRRQFFISLYYTSIKGRFFHVSGKKFFYTSIKNNFPSDAEKSIFYTCIKKIFPSHVE